MELPGQGCVCVLGNVYTHFYWPHSDTLRKTGLGLQVQVWLALTDATTFLECPHSSTSS